MTEQVNLPQGIPPLNQYYYYLTAGCSLRCKHCWLAPDYQKDGTTGGHLDFELFKLSIEEGIPLGLSTVKLTGGEPLLHPDFLPMLAHLKEKNISVTLETNGTLLTPEIAKFMKENSSVYFVSVSMDGAKAETHDRFRGVRGAYEKSVAGIRMLVEQGFHPQIIMSLHEGNVAEIEDLVMLAQAWEAGSVKFNLIQPSGRAEKMQKRGELLDIHRLVELGKWVEGDLQKRVSIQLYYSWSVVFQSIARLLKFGASSCGIHRILGVLADGSLAMCGMGVSVPELTYGKLGVDLVLYVWRDNAVINQIRRDIPSKLEDPCGKCLFKWQCLGSCIADNYHQTKRLTAPFWFCKQAYDEGLFPVSRLV